VLYDGIYFVSIYGCYVTILTFVAVAKCSILTPVQHIICRDDSVTYLLFQIVCIIHLYNIGQITDAVMPKLDIATLVL